MIDFCGICSRKRGDGVVVWVTGLSGSGKTTLCAALRSLLKPRIPELVLIDGDIVREIFGGDLGFGEADRARQIKRIQSLARELDKQGQVVIVAALYAHPDLLHWNRQNFKDYFEIYLDAPLSLVRQRDPKGLYGKAARGEIESVVGIDVPWNPPANPDLRIDVATVPKPAELARNVAQAIPRFAAALQIDQMDAVS
ncbi:adenylyl-sulfate kinase [Hongsoonwoonella zoysiae]|uniref:adenylyl-sulfate kinase n=1 Tax=Hongsoonwoonella zoysiae TaxID=2821844 RepID=UPI001FE8E8E8|nr:adenylyl-sulfate kinase [Hongsoonwoonella zoysiae]